MHGFDFKNLFFETSRLRVNHWAARLVDPDTRLVFQDQLSKVLTADVLRDLPPSLQLGDGIGITEWVDARVDECDCFDITHAETAETVGLLILIAMSSEDTRLDVHIGYLFGESEWGKGYATEMLRAAVTACRDIGPCRLIGGVAKSNPASAHILKKLGFELDHASSDVDTDQFSLLLN